MEIDGNTKKKVLPIYSQNLSWPLVYLQKSLEGWWRTRWAENIWNIGSSQVHKGRLWDLFHLKKKSLGFLNLSTNPARSKDEVANRTLQYKSTLI